MADFDIFEHVSSLGQRADSAIYDLANTENAAAAGDIGSEQHWDEEVERVTVQLHQRIEEFALGLVNLCDHSKFSSLSNRISGFWEENKNQSTNLEYYDFPYGPESRVLERLKSFSKTIPLNKKKLVEQHPIVENIMNQLGATIQKLGMHTTKEKDIQDVLDIVMRAVFPDVISYPASSKQTKTYKPDLGLENAGIAIELKFADTPAKAKKVLGEVYEDMKGYAGDRHWRHFIAGIYLHSPLLSQQQVDAELKKVGCPKNWTVKIIVGP